MKRTIVLAAALLLIFFGSYAQEKTDKKNLVIKEWNTDVRSGIRLLDHVTTFNSEGRKVEEIEYGADERKWRKRYEYGSRGKVSRELLYDERDRLESVKKFEYDEQGKKKMQYTYNSKGKLQSVKFFEYLTEDA